MIAPAGLTRVGRPFLRKVIAVYVVLAVAAIAIPALVMRPRPLLAHPTEQATTTRPHRSSVIQGSELR